MSANPGSSLTGKTVVIADDDEVSRTLLRGVLVKSGMQVLAEASDGTEALAAFEQHRPQVVCLDIEMPECPASTCSPRFALPVRRSSSS